MKESVIQLKEMFIYNSKDMNKPGQITGLYSAGLCKGTYYRVYFPRTGEIEYVNIRNVRYDPEKVLYQYDDKNVIKKK